MSRLDPYIWDKVVFWGLVVGTIFALVMASQGCATPPTTAPLIGACLVDGKEGIWLCKDAFGKNISPLDSKYVCYDLEKEWRPLMNYCKKEPK